jgi:hypothetical protein
MLLALLVVLAAAPVSGRIIDAESNNPIAGAHVMLIPAEQMPPPGGAAPFDTVTDASGHFVFEAVAPGQYRVDAQMPGFVPFAAAAPVVDTTAGQAIAGIEVFLKKGGAITGRIVDGGGQPLPFITVSALEHAVNSHADRAMAVTKQMAQTNDLGEFRLVGLADGDYVVIAAPQPQRPFAQPAPGGAALSPTYYPGTADRDAAQIISVASAQTVSDLQFALISTPAYEVSGVVVDEAGSPLRAALVMLTIDPQDGGTGTPAMSQSDENGMFRIGGVVPGTYQLTAAPQTMWAPHGGLSASDGRGGGGVVPITGGVSVGAASLDGPEVVPPVAKGLSSPPIEVTVGSGDVSGLKIVVTTQR